MTIKDLLNRLEDSERRFVGTEFLAPVVNPRGPVVVRIAGVVCRLKVSGLPRRFQGYAILRARSTAQAEFVREATLAEIAQYLALFPALRLILVQRWVPPQSDPARPSDTAEGPSGGQHRSIQGRAWLAFSAQRGDRRFQIKGPAIVQLPEEGLERFETVITRFDGRLFWYERRDPSRNPALADYLRGQIVHAASDGLPPKTEHLHKRELSQEERAAYAWVRGLLIEARRDQIELRLADALAHAGAVLRSYIERDDAYVVTYQVDGQQHISTIRPEDLTIMTAGICLSGQDQRFDLTSLVGVLREAAVGERLVRVGADGLEVARYWQIHPPEDENR